MGRQEWVVRVTVNTTPCFYLSAHWQGWGRSLGCHTCWANTPSLSQMHGLCFWRHRLESESLVTVQFPQGYLFKGQCLSTLDGAVALGPSSVSEHSHQGALNTWAWVRGSASPILETVSWSLINIYVWIFVLWPQNKHMEIFLFEANVLAEINKQRSAVHWTLTQAPD